jgi:hypothetical protein
VFDVERLGTALVTVLSWSCCSFVII